MELDIRNFCLQPLLNIQSLSLSCKALPRIGRPFGPGGTFRHGLVAYCTATSRMTTMLRMRSSRGVRCWENAANETQRKDSRVMQMRVVAEPGVIPTAIAVMMQREIPSGVSGFGGGLRINACRISRIEDAQECGCGCVGTRAQAERDERGLPARENRTRWHERRTAGTMETQEIRDETRRAIAGPGDE
jgi:hypothetical protein